MGSTIPMNVSGRRDTHHLIPNAMSLPVGAWVAREEGNEYFETSFARYRTVENVSSTVWTMMHDD